jgi:hypothetical protein
VTRSALTRRLLIAAGAAVVVGILGSDDLFQAAIEPKRLWLVDGARHQDLFAYDPAGYEAQVVGFLRKYL